MHPDKAFDKYTPDYCRKRLRKATDDWGWFFEFRWTDHFGVRYRRKLMLKGEDLALMGTQASELVRYVIRMGWNAMLTRYYRAEPNVGQHMDKYQTIFTRELRTFKLYENDVYWWAAAISGFGELDGSYKYGRNK